MGDAPRDWEGQLVDGIFPLKKYLGGSDHSAVFLTEYAEGERGRAAIKFVPAERATADLRLTNWRVTAQMAHPNLLRLFRAGRCRVDGNDLLYVVMEHADEGLSDILPTRALTADETREMLNPVLDALEYLHGKGFVHSDLKPTNILAAGDQLKLSSDMISRAGETQGTSKKSSVYDAPEAISGMKTSAGDVWALGTTLVEVLTQKVPEWQPGPHREPVVPASVPEPFGEIARACLRLEPDRRVTVADIAERLNTKAVAAETVEAIGAPAERSERTAPVVAAPAAVMTSAAAAASSATPAAMPMASAAAAGLSAASVPPTAPRVSPPVDTAIPAKPTLRTQTVAARGGRPQIYGAQASTATGKRPKYLVPLIGAALVFAVMLTVPRLFRKSTSPASNGPLEQPAVVSAKKPAAAIAAPGSKPDKKGAKATKSAAANTATPPSAPRFAPAASTGSPTPAIQKEPTVAANNSAVRSSDATPRPVAAKVDASKGEVLDQVMPEVSGKARGTIHGHVRVGVRIHVDAAGAVSDAILDAPGPSAFFADSALKAARQWTFTPPEVNGKSVPSEWLLHFVFTESDTKVAAGQVKP